MATLNNWRKSSYSGGGDGNDCVLIANSLTHVGVRDSKTQPPAATTLTFPTTTFTPFLNSLKHPT